MKFKRESEKRPIRKSKVTLRNILASKRHHDKQRKRLSVVVGAQITEWVAELGLGEWP